MSAGHTSSPESALTQLLSQGVAERVFPSAQATVICDGKIVASVAVGAATSTLFDIASVTKVMSTTAIFMSLWREGRVGPETPLARFFPRSPAAQAGVTLADLLYHRSGLPAFVPFFARAMPAVPELFQRPSASVRAEVRRAVVEAAAATSLRSAPGERAVYSDVGFILLGESLAMAGDAPLDALFAQRIAAPLGLDAAYRRLSVRQTARDIAPTGTTRPREPAPGQENLWATFPAHASEAGEVDDDNAWVLDGVAGHAGVFATSGAVARFGQAAVDGFAGDETLSHPSLWRRAVLRDLTRDSTRALGFDTPSADTPSCGERFGAQPPGAIGHLGFTGSSLWIDLPRKLVVALCTNRVALGRANVAIRGFRPRFHDAVLDALGLGA